MITVHHLNSSRSHRVLWLLEELGAPYEIQRYQRNPKTLLAPPELKKVHPLGKSPVITGEGHVIAESGAILEYLVDHYDQAGALRPVPGSEALLRYRHFMHYAEGSLMSPLFLSLVFLRMPKQPTPFFMKPVVKGIADRALSSFVRPQIKLHLDYLEGALSQTTWFAGDEFSAADIQLSYPLIAASSRAGLDASRPKLTAFLKRIAERPAYQRAIERGGPVTLDLD